MTAPAADRRRHVSTGSGPGKDDVAGDEQLVEAPPLGGRQHRAQRVEVAVNVRKAEEQHGVAVGLEDPRRG